MPSKIEWTDETWNPASGCTKVSQGCANCYIERTPPFRMAGRRFVMGAIPVLLHPDRLDQPLRWRKPRRVFVCSLADLFHEDVPDAFIDRVFSTMARAYQHTFQVLTKRPQRMRDYVTRVWWGNAFHESFASTFGHVWLGVSVENQRMADERIPVLLDTPAAAWFVSCEPLLSGLDVTPWLGQKLRISMEANPGTLLRGTANVGSPGVSWVIVGGESGPGRAERKLVERCVPPGIGSLHRQSCDCGGTGWRPKPHALEWVDRIRGDCQAAGVAFFFKGWAGPRPTSGGRMLDGRTWEEFPDGAGRAL